MKKSESSFISYKIFVCILLFSSLSVFLFPHETNAQSESERGLPFITNYSPKTYKAFPQTWCVLEDESGIMYFGSQSVLLEYDGVKWRQIALQSNAGTAVVRSMAKHKDGLIYYGGFGDIGYLDNDSLGQKRPVSLMDLVPDSNRNFLDVWTTHSTASGIYFQAREYIFRLDDKKKGDNDKRKMKVWKPETKFMYSFYLDGTLYVHQQGLGLYKMINDSLVFIPGSEFLGKERMQVMLPYKSTVSEKQYLIGLFYSGLYLFNGKTFQAFATKADSIVKSGTLLYKGLKMKNGSYVLCTTAKGLVIIDEQGSLLQIINRDVGLQDESIYSAYEDSKGALWLALDNGISRVETASPLTKFALQSGITTGVLNITRYEGDLYIGTTNGLLIFNKKTSIFDPIPGIPQNQIFTVLPDGKQLLVPGDGLFSVSNKKAFTIRPSVSADLTLSALHISKKYPDLLIGGGTFGVAVFTRASGKIRNKESAAWKFAGYVKDISDQIWSFSENEDGSLWAGTQAGVDYLIHPAFDEKGNFDLHKTRFEKYGAEHGYKYGIGQVYSIKGKNYFFGDSALYSFDEKVKRFIPDTTFGRFDNGGGNTEFEMVEDQKGRVWIRLGKDTRLAVPKPEGGYRIDKTQLSSINELTIQKIYPERNGIVWICTTDGLIRYDENLEKNIEQSFKTLIRHISAGEKILSTILKTDTKPASVSFQDNTLRFEYAAPFFDQEEKTTYQTWLEGFEKDWSDFDNNYYKEYTNLPVGNYHFHVRAKNIYQNISEEAVYSFSIYPPWYLTWWAYLVYFLASVSLIYLIIRYRTKNLQEKHRELEKEVTDRTGQLSLRVEELAVINSVQEGLVREMDMEGIYELVGEKIREIFSAQVIDIVTYDKSANLLEDKYAYEKGDRTLLKPRPPKGFRKHVIDTGQLIMVNENVEQVSREYNNELLIGEMPKSMVYVPMIVGDDVKGIISLQHMDKEHAFTESDVNLLTTLANSMSVALESARLFDETNRLLKETEQRTAELSVINSVQEGLVREMDMIGIYKLVGDRLCTIFPDSQTLVIRTFDHETGLEHFHYTVENGEHLDISSRPFIWESKQLIRTKKPLDIESEYETISIQNGETAVTEGFPVKSAVFVPMIVGEQVKGSISLQNVDHENAFNESDIRLLTTLTNSMSVALENARLFDETNRLLKETEQRTAELSVINNVQDGLSKELDIQSIYALVGEKMREVFNAQVIDIVTYDKTTSQIEDRYTYEKGDRTLLGPRPLKGFRKHVIETGKQLVINTDMEKMMQELDNVVLVGEKSKSAIFVPMIASGEVTGVISLQNLDQENAFSASDVRLLNTLGNSMSVALESARLFDETNRLLGKAKQSAAELSTVNSISKALASQLDPDDLIKMVGDQLKDLFKANVVYLALLNKKTGIIHFPYQYGDEMEPIKLGEGLTSKIIKNGEPLLINKDLNELRTQLGIKQIGVPAASYLGVPIPVGDEIIGVLSIQSTEQENRFNENDLRLLSTIASSVGVALRNATLFDEVQQAKMEAEAASKLAEKANEAKSAFLSTVSHELRTPLTSVLGFAKIIKKRLEERIFPLVDKADPKIEKAVNQVSENLYVVISEGERLTHLINDVLDLAKIEAGKMEFSQDNVSMAEVAVRAIAATTSLFDQKELKLIRQIDENLPEIIGDKDKLIQVIINLISNSVKFTDAGSITCRVRQEKDELIVSIIDTGIGIAPGDFGAVFEQFKQVGGDTLTDKPKGTGLGLPICKEIVEHLGGRIWLESEPGIGSTFSFALPINKKTTADRPIHLNDLVRQLKEQVAHSQLNVIGQAAKILIVDDDDSIRSLLHQELGDAGYHIDEASNGKEALERVRTNRPDLIILDIMMPEMNGFDVAAVLKNDPQTMDIPIIVLSVVQDKARGFRIGVDRYLTKPIDTGLLFNEIGNLLEQGKSKRRVMIVDEDTGAVNALTEVLKTKGYDVMESNETELFENAVANPPDIIIISAVFSGKQDIVKTLRFEKGLENVLFLVYQ